MSRLVIVHLLVGIAPWAQAQAGGRDSTVTPAASSTASSTAAHSSASTLSRPPAASEATLQVWHGDAQRVGHLGRPQPDFNLLGHVAPWREVDTLEWKLNQQAAVQLNFRAFRRLEHDGDFNADVPIARLRPGPNTVVIAARFRDGPMLHRTVTIDRQEGRCPLPLTIRWRNVSHPQDVGQYVDGRWRLGPEGLRTAAAGYDRLFLIGDHDWENYEVEASFVVHALLAHLKNDAGVGLIAHFAGHVTGGPEHFPSGQPKWGYRPFGAIGWVRWRGEAGPRPRLQYFPGAQDRPVDCGEFPFRLGESYRLRFACQNLPEEEPRGQVTEYRFKIWPGDAQEPANWSWVRKQKIRDALRVGGLALIAHYADVSFGDLHVRRID